MFYFHGGPTINKTNLSYRGNLGAKIYLMFAGCMLLNLVITYFVFPELKGRTPAEVDEMFEARLSARKFKGMCFILHNHLLADMNGCLQAISVP